MENKKQVLVGDLLKKYPNHQVIMSGNKESIPYTNLPKELQGLSGKKFMSVAKKLPVASYEINNLPRKEISMWKNPGKITNYKGRLSIYFKKGK